LKSPKSTKKSAKEIPFANFMQQKGSAGLRPRAYLDTAKSILRQVKPTIAAAGLSYLHPDSNFAATILPRFG